jgi:predicted nucleotidyltransferase
MTTIVPLEPEELLSALQRHGVEFVIVGGFSLAAHGVVRATKDIDVVPNPARANLERLTLALAEMKAEIDVGDLAPDELGVTLNVEGFAQGGNFCLLTEHGRLDVMQDLSGMSSYTDLRDDATQASMPGVSEPLFFAGYEDLVAMKSAAGRDQDLIDLTDLRRARGEDDR